MAYNGNSSKIVSSSFLYSTLQTFYTKIKGLLDKKSDVSHTHNYLPTTGGVINGGLVLSSHNSLRSRHVDGSTDGYDGELYLNYNSPDANIYLGNNGYCIAYNGSYYTGTSSNSDMLDGLHEGSFQRHFNGYINNFDTTLTDGEYSFGSSEPLTGSPVTSGGLYGKLIVKVNDGGTHDNAYNWIWQFAYCTNGRNYWRYKVNEGVWQSWQKFNDGGNADTLDGYHAWQMGGWSDNRYVNTQPNDYNAKFEVKGLKSNSSINSPDNSSFSTVLGLRAWGDYTGGDAHELAFTASGQIFQRHGSTDSWGSWNRLYTSKNITYGTSALTPGSSSLATGNIYLQYE